jgi:ssDNA-binding Zn-finger/Zn-ribbon topoisomerase 1
MKPRADHRPTVEREKIMEDPSRRHNILEKMERKTEETVTNYKICPACNYVRQPTDIAPEWECPKCQKSYNKVGRLETPKESFLMAQSSTDYIEVTISEENNLEVGSQLQFGTSENVDPIAMRNSSVRSSH